jgi:hypothetical protein
VRHRLLMVALSVFSNRLFVATADFTYTFRCGRNIFVVSSKVTGLIVSSVKAYALGYRIVCGLLV